MADTDRALTRRERAVAVNAAEGAVRAALTQSLFGGAGDAHYRAAESREVVEVLTRAVADITAEDTEGLRSGRALDGRIAAAATQIAAGVAAVLDEICVPISGGGVPWLPILGPASPGPDAPVPEKTTLPSAPLTVEGVDVTPQFVGEAVDVPFLIKEAISDELLAVLGARSLLAQFDWLVDQLEAEAGYAPDLTSAISELGVTGWPASYVLATPAAWAGLADPQGPTQYAGLPVLVGGLGNRALVVSSLGAFCGRLPSPTITAVEPRVGGLEIAIGSWYAVQVEPGAVAVIGEAPVGQKRTRKASS